jgi:hypothetical protein
VSRWTVADDAALIRLMGYLKHQANLGLTGTLGPDDLLDLELRVWTDADWNGNPNTTKSTSGLYIELFSPTSGHEFPIVWRTALQTSTASSSAESETVSLSTGLRQEALPIQELLEMLLGKKLWIMCKVDNTQALAAAKKGYSKRLRHLGRTQRVSLGVLNELIEDADMKVQMNYASTTEQKADIFTKAMQPAAFIKARSLISMAECVATSSS